VALGSISVGTTGSGMTNLEFEWTRSRVSIEMESRHDIDTRLNVPGNLRFYCPDSGHHDLEERNLEAMSNAA
jgi:hypothetical protein